MIGEEETVGQACINGGEEKEGTEREAWRDTGHITGYIKGCESGRNSLSGRARCAKACVDAYVFTDLRLITKSL